LQDNKKQERSNRQKTRNISRNILQEDFWFCIQLSFENRFANIQDTTNLVVEDLRDISKDCFCENLIIARYYNNNNNTNKALED